MLFKVGFVLLAAWFLGLIGLYRVGDLFHFFLLGGLALCCWASCARERLPCAPLVKRGRRNE